MISLARYRYLLLFLAAALLATPGPLQGKGTPADILIQTTTDVQGEIAPCG